MSDCTDCLLDLTDACPRGAGRAVDDEICDAFFPKETYEVNKNESWQLGYQHGMAEEAERFLDWLFKKGYVRTDNWEMWHLGKDDILREYKEQNNE